MSQPNNAAAQLLEALRESDRAEELHENLLAHSTASSASSASSSSSSAATFSDAELIALWDELTEANDEPGIKKFLAEHPDFFERLAANDGADALPPRSVYSAAAVTETDDDDDVFETDDAVNAANAGASNIRGNPAAGSDPATFVELYGEGNGRTHWEVWVTIGAEFAKFDLTSTGYRIIYQANLDRRDGMRHRYRALVGITAGQVAALYDTVRARRGPYQEGSNDCHGFAADFFDAVTELQPIPTAQGQ
ncbi:hypothetical protein AB0M36_24445 [Actinoplanes sp. NPDC051346]|uniref:hypothetical protein n=1 Tax=Actinoplanes sp. NPDC051346 TaxID=3155048 RepID=UPI00344277F1